MVTRILRNRSETHRRTVAMDCMLAWWSGHPSLLVYVMRYRHWQQMAIG